MPKSGLPGECRSRGGPQGPSKAHSPELSLPVNLLPRLSTGKTPKLTSPKPLFQLTKQGHGASFTHNGLTRALLGGGLKLEAVLQIRVEVGEIMSPELWVRKVEEQLLFAFPIHCGEKQGAGFPAQGPF